MRIIIYSSDKTQWSLQPFAYLFNRYWSERIGVDVYLNSPMPFDLPRNFITHGIGAFKPADEWSTDFINALKSLDDEVICVMMDDYWLNRRVNAEAVYWCAGYMIEHPEVARFDLTTDRLYAEGMRDYCKIEYLDVIRSDPKSPYHFSLQAALWRREHLLSCLVPHETPWLVEERGNSRLRQLGALVLGTKQSPIHYTIAIQRGKFTPDGGYQSPTNAMQESDVRHIIEQGWIPTEMIGDGVTA